MSAKTCRSCDRKPGTGTIKGQGDSDRGTAKAVELCVPCLAEASWENEHSDKGHESGSKYQLSSDDELAACWVCHPELNEATAPTVERTGTSRAGMTINVPIRATGKEKAQHVAELLKSMAVSVSVRKGVVTLKAASAVGEGVKVQWDMEGRLLGAQVTTGDKVRKVRNVAEVLRLAP